MDQLQHATTTIYGGLNVDFSDSVTAYLHGGYERMVRTAFDGIPAEADGSPAPLARSFFTGSKNIELTTSAYHAEGDLTWHASDMLEFSIKGNIDNSNVVGSQAYASGLQPNGDININADTILEERNNNYGIGLSSVYHFDGLGLRNSFVSIGALYQDNRQPGSDLYANGATANIFQGEAAVSHAFEALLAGPLSPFAQEVDENTLTFSGQSVLQLIDPVSLLLGISYSKPKETEITQGVTQDFQFHSQMSYRAGLTYEFLPRTTAYLSYSESFNPQTALHCDVRTQTTCLSSSVLPPQTGSQYEVGVKYRSTNALLLTGALFEIKQRNLAQFDFADQVTGSDYFKPIGEVTHKGAELQALGQLTHEWQINAGYAYLDPKVTANNNAAIVGQTRLFLPKQTFSVYTTYALQRGILRGLSIDGGARYVSAQRTSYDGSTKDLPGYTLVDATLGYTVGKWLVQLNVHNIFDRRYFFNSYQTLFYGNVVGDPINAALSIRREF